MKPLRVFNNDGTTTTYTSWWKYTLHALRINWLTCTVIIVLCAIWEVLAVVKG